MEKSPKETKTTKTSIFTPKKTAGYFFVSLITNIVVALIIWPLLDLFWCNVVTYSPFSYSVENHIIWPIIIMAIVSIVEFIFFDFFFFKIKKK